MNIEVVLLKTDLFELVRLAGGNPDNHGRCACPIHGGDNETAFSIYKNNGKQSWKCHSGDCGGGDALDFVRKWRNWDMKQAYEFLGGEKQADPYEMKRLADERHERARLELEDKQRRMEAARRELQVAERHILYHNTMKEWGRNMFPRASQCMRIQASILLKF